MSSSKNSSSKAGSSSQVGPEVAAEIARLMRDPNALRSERSLDVSAEIARLMRDPDALRHERGGRGHYDPNQPRVPAGDPRGGQFASKGYRGGDSNRDPRATPASLDAAQFAQLGQGNPGGVNAQAQPFGGVFGNVDAGEHLNSRRDYYQFIESNPQAQRLPFGRFVIVPTQPTSPVQLPNGYQFTFTSTAYGYDPDTGAFVTIRATYARPVVVREINGVVSIERR